MNINFFKKIQVRPPMKRLVQRGNGSASRKTHPAVLPMRGQTGLIKMKMNRRRKVVEKTFAKSSKTKNSVKLRNLPPKKNRIEGHVSKKSRQYSTNWLKLKKTLSWRNCLWILIQNPKNIWLKYTNNCAKNLNHIKLGVRFFFSLSF